MLLKAVQQKYKNNRKLSVNVHTKIKQPEDADSSVWNLIILVVKCSHVG